MTLESILTDIYTKNTDYIGGKGIVDYEIYEMIKCCELEQTSTSKDRLCVVQEYKIKDSTEYKLFLLYMGHVDLFRHCIFLKHSKSDINRLFVIFDPYSGTIEIQNVVFSK